MSWLRESRSEGNMFDIVKPLPSLGLGESSSSLIRQELGIAGEELRVGSSSYLPVSDSWAAMSRDLQPLVPVFVLHTRPVAKA
jgi:hypothetical protein